MTMRLRTVFLIALGILVLWFFYLESAILTPFVVAGIFAYVFNPVVNFLSRKIQFPRVLSVVVIYIFLIGMVVVLGIFLSGRILEESSQLSLYIREIAEATNKQMQNLPDWMQPTAKEAVISMQKSIIFSPEYLFSLFPQALSRLVSFLLFLFTGFFFLKDGSIMIQRLLSLIPNDFKFDVDILFQKINAVLNGYLRGQIFMIFLVSFVLFIALSILGVRFSLILAIFSGIAEIVPIVGPIVATSIAAMVALFGGTANFGFTPFQGAVIVIVIYTVTRQLQDYFIIPYIMGKITKLHPFLILFSVIAGEHLFGILGLVLGVPIAAVIRILLEYSLDKINDHGVRSVASSHKTMV